MTFHTEPEVHSRTLHEEQGYRRGFSQGVAALAYGIGMKPSDYHRTSFERQVERFRTGRRKTAPWKLTESQVAELKVLLLLDQREAA